MKHSLRLLFVAALGAIALGASARANQILQWNALMIQSVRLDNSGPNLCARNLAIMHTAIFDAVNSIAGTHQPYRFEIPIVGEVSIEAAVAGAAYDCATILYPVSEREAKKIFAESVPSQDTEAVRNGLALGRQIAKMALRSRENDGISADAPYIPSKESGQWRRTPPYFRPPSNPQWRNVTLFALPEKESFLPPPPPALNSAEYAASLNEVKALGRKTGSTRNPEQTQIAIFWSDFSYTSMPPGHWHQIAASICRERHTSLEDTARLFALLSVAQADAATVCWEAKYRYNFWRPITAIQRADEDDNSWTERDAKWDHLLAAPSFPSYVSGHSIFSKASAEILTRFFKTDAIAFSATSDTLPGVARHFTSFAQCADEIGMSRIYGGIHFSFDNLQGKASGQRIGEYVSEHCLLAKN
jgi:hypothetical protein